MQFRLALRRADAQPPFWFPRSAPAHSRIGARRSKLVRPIPSSRPRRGAAAAHPRHGRNKFCARKSETPGGAGFRPRPTGRSRCLLRSLALLDQFPELAVLSKLIVFRHREFAAEKKIPERIFVEDAVDGDSFRPALEINPVILRAITMKLFSLTLDYAKSARVEVVEVLGKDLEFSQQIELQGLRQRR